MGTFSDWLEDFVAEFIDDPVIFFSCVFVFIVFWVFSYKMDARARKKAEENGTLDEYLERRRQRMESHKLRDSINKRLRNSAKNHRRHSENAQSPIDRILRKNRQRRKGL